jgi:hypothetical protein
MKALSYQESRIPGKPARLGRAFAGGRRRARLVALHRGESINAVWIVVAAVAST